MNLINFYEVQSADGSVEWGGASPLQAVHWFRKSADSSIFVSVWDEEDIEEPRLVTDKINVTDLMLALMREEREENLILKPKKEWAY